MSTVALIHTRAGESITTTTVPADVLDIEVEGQYLVLRDDTDLHRVKLDALVTLEIRRESRWWKWWRR